MSPDSFSAQLARDVSRETFEKLDAYVAILLSENQKQNLISKGSEAEVWERHILDSAQLVQFADEGVTSCVDIGAGAGLPGIVLSILTDHDITMIEPRPLRTAFLNSVIDRLDLRNAHIVQGKADSVTREFDVITGRAVAPLARFLSLSHHLSTEKTRWVLPKGRKVLHELEDARRLWQLEVTVAPSMTDDDARILVIDRAVRKGRA